MTLLLAQPMSLSARPRKRSACALVNFYLRWLHLPFLSSLLHLPAAPGFGISTSMASDALEALPKVASSHEDLTDEQMEELLAQATSRLKEKEEGKMFESEAPQQFTFPKMDAGNLEKPYATTKGHITQADKSRLIDDKARQSEGLIRKVEDPVMAKKIAAEVRLQSFMPLPSPCL